ncbi:MAG: dipeptide ABC transporter ATP-binding protein [Deltaproteobacteria bacterium]|nr:MAG: dipeptide ABC transporter ATP-binding protein [Deltaproteobacteria bacterium]
MREVILQAADLTRHYRVQRRGLKKPATLKALDGATFTLAKGETLAVVGESGCGKSTLARLVTLIEEPTSGELLIKGMDVSKASKKERRALHKKVQIVFQDPYGSLNPRQKIGMALEEPLLVNTSMSKSQREEKAREMINLVGLRPEHYERYPHMFSGGQRQRVAIARALMLEPEILVLDEPVSALDVSIQAQILNLLIELQERLNLAYLFISHDLSVVEHIADEVMVMYLGVPVEKGSREKIFKNPRHPYTRVLLSATPIADPFRQKERIVLKGELPSPINPPDGCSFHPRCPDTMEVCTSVYPERRVVDEDVKIACHGAGS